MPGGIPDGLDGDLAALYGAIGRFISQGIGADRVYRILRDAGAGIPRAQVRKVAAEIRTSLGFRADIARLNPDNPVPARLVSTNSSLRTDSFVHTVSMILRDKTTGYTFQQYYTYVSADLTSPSEIFDAADGDGGGDGSWYEFDVVAITLIAVSHRP